MPIYSITTAQVVGRHIELIIEADSPEEACALVLSGEGYKASEIISEHRKLPPDVLDIHQLARPDQPFYEGQEVQIPESFRRPWEYNENLSEAIADAVGRQLGQS